MIRLACRIVMSKASAQSSRSENPVVRTASWLTSGAPQPHVGRFPVLEPERSDLPRIIADLGAGEIAARIAAWRAGNRQLDALFRENAPPAQALRWLGLTLWAAGELRQASVILTTAAAISPDSAPLWQELGFTLQAIGDRPGAREASNGRWPSTPPPRAHGSVSRWSPTSSRTRSWRRRLSRPRWIAIPSCRKRPSASALSASNSADTRRPRAIGAPPSRPDVKIPMFTSVWDSAFSSWATSPARLGRSSGTSHPVPP